MPWEIIRAGGTIIDKGLKFEKFNLITWAINNKPRMKIICLELMVGFSFFEIKINTPQQNIVSRNDIDQDTAISRFRDLTSRTLIDEIIDMRMQIRRITKLSIFLNGVGTLWGDWVLIHKIWNFFNRHVRFCTEYILIYFFFLKL